MEEHIFREFEEIKEIMATAAAGLAALQQAVTDLTAAVTEATAAFSATGDSDGQVAALAADVQAQVGALKAAIPSAAPEEPVALSEPAA